MYDHVTLFIFHSSAYQNVSPKFISLNLFVSPGLQLLCFASLSFLFLFTIGYTRLSYWLQPKQFHISNFNNDSSAARLSIHFSKNNKMYKTICGRHNLNATTKVLQSPQTATRDFSLQHMNRSSAALMSRLFYRKDSYLKVVPRTLSSSVSSTVY